jgi:hypothetical protein
MRVCSPWIFSKLNNRKQLLGLYVELDHPYLVILVADKVTIGDRKAHDIGVVQGHDGALEM